MVCISAYKQAQSLSNGFTGVAREVTVGTWSLAFALASASMAAGSASESTVKEDTDSSGNAPSTEKSTRA